MALLSAIIPSLARASTNIGSTPFWLKTTKLSLQVDDLLHAVLDKLPLGRDQLLTLLGRLAGEAGVDLGLLVLQGDVASQDETVLQAFRHVGVTASVVHHKAFIIKHVIKNWHNS